MKAVSKTYYLSFYPREKNMTLNNKIKTGRKNFRSHSTDHLNYFVFSFFRQLVHAYVSVGLLLCIGDISRLGATRSN